MTVELFFDYTCPFCYQGHQNLLELRDKYPQLEIIWRPCEAHPRPETALRHSDLAIQGMYFIRDHHGDLWNYHKLTFETVFAISGDISDLETLTAIAAQCDTDTKAFSQALSENQYGREVEEGNRYAWEEHSLNAVPSYLSGQFFVGSHDGILVSKEELDNFLAKLSTV